MDRPNNPATTASAFDCHNVRQKVGPSKLLPSPKLTINNPLQSTSAKYVSQNPEVTLWWYDLQKEVDAAHQKYKELSPGFILY